MGKLGVIVANTGSPSEPTPEAVRSYLAEFLSDPRICPMHPRVWGFILNTFILPKRSVRSARKYQAIWTPEGSPLATHMQSLATRLQNALAEDGIVCEVRHAMSYGSPSVGDVLSELRACGCGEVAAIPLYPQAAFSTTQVVADKLAEASRRLGWPEDARLVDGYSREEGYASAVAEAVLEAGFDPRRDSLLFAFHSIPMRDINAGDTYGERALETAAEVAEALGIDSGSWRVGFQCRFDKSRAWLGPTTSEALAALAPNGGRLFVVAPNFSVDCLETLLDIDVELRERFMDAWPSATADSFRYVPCLNDSPAHVQLLKRIVLKGR